MKENPFVDHVPHRKPTWFPRLALRRVCQEDWKARGARLKHGHAGRESKSTKAVQRKPKEPKEIPKWHGT
eukprot:s51_g5.t1